MDENIVLCSVSSYDQKYYFNEEFAALPEQIQRELKIMCVWYSEEVGGILTLEFAQDGTLTFQTAAKEYDATVDEIGSVLKIKQFQREKKEMLEALELYYRVFYLGEEV